MAAPVRQKWIVKAKLHQCMVGLTDLNGFPMRKATLLLSSHESLVKRLRVQCDHSHTHSVVEGQHYGINRSVIAQKWPDKMCS